MLALFPSEKPDYSFDPISGSDELSADSRLSFGSAYAQVVTVIRCGDKVSRGISRVKRDRLSGKLLSDRLIKRIVIQSFYRAALRHIETPPVWGSLTGIRPAHLAARALEAGQSERSAMRTLSRDYYVSTERSAMCTQAAKSSLALKRTLAPEDIALYVGIPFCPTRCAYCSFVSNSVEKSFGLIEPFVQTLLNEIDAAAAVVSKLGLRIISVYIGGGTPTSLPAEGFESVMLALKKMFDLSCVREYTVEAGRPDTIDERKLEIMGRFGVNRICVNPQSMSAEVLSAIDRRHTPGDVAKAVRLVRQLNTTDSTGFEPQNRNVSKPLFTGTGASGQTPKMALNMDIIAGLPSDSPEGFRHTLDTILDFMPESITVHTLSQKKGSRIMVEGSDIPDGTNVAKMLDYASCNLRKNGYTPYYLYRQKFTSGGFENTGWSLPGYEGIYNICMMEELCTVLALGAGGVTKLVSPGGRIERIFNAKYAREYILLADKFSSKFNKVMDFQAQLL